MPSIIFATPLEALEFVSLVGAICIALFLAIIVYRSDRKSATNIFFCLLSIFIVMWLVYAYIVNLSPFLDDATFLARLGIFFAAPMSSLFFLFAHTLPSEKVLLSKKNFNLVIIATVIMMAFNISPYAFTSATIENNAVHPIPGWGFIPFAVLSTLFSILAIYYLIKKAIIFRGDEREQVLFVLTGILVMLFFVIITVLIPIIFFGSGFFVAFFPLYTTIFVGMTSYAIVKHHLFNLKVIATESFTILLWIILMARLMSSSGPGELALNAIIMTGALIFGVLLIKSVRREVEQREELEKLSHFKTQILSVVSHQIRSPLAAVKGFASLLLDGTYGKLADEQKEIIGKMKNESDQLIEMVNNLLDFRRIEEGRMEYKYEPIDIVKMAKDIVEELRPLAEEKKLELSASSTSPSIMVNADVQKLRQVILNLVDNAIKYTPQGFVKLEVKPVSGKVIISVTDSGFGMAPDLIGKVFEEFVRGEGTKKEIRGTGLGLYIAKSIVEAHGGKIWAESPGDGKGSTFFVELKRLN